MLVSHIRILRCELKSRSFSCVCKTFGCDKNSVVGKYFLANIIERRCTWLNIVS